MRNAVLHGYFEIIADNDNSFKTVLNFWDLNVYKGIQIADFYFTADSLNSLINLLIKDVCLKYLDKNGWVLE